MVNVDECELHHLTPSSLLFHAGEVQKAQFPPVIAQRLADRYGL